MKLSGPPPFLVVPDIILAPDDLVQVPGDTEVPNNIIQGQDPTTINTLEGTRVVIDNPKIKIGHLPILHSPNKCPLRKQRPHKGPQDFIHAVCHPPLLYYISFTIVNK